MTTYRMHDKLGGLPARIVSDGSGGWVRVEVAGYELDCRRSDLVEVRPPSIDDPVTLPLEIEDLDGDRLRVEDMDRGHVWPRPGANKVGAYVSVVSRAGDSRGDGVYLTADGLRRLARACWRRANAIEAAQ